MTHLGPVEGRETNNALLEEKNFIICTVVSDRVHNQLSPAAGS